MTTDFRKNRDEGLRSLYWTLIRSGKSQGQALEIVYEEQRDKYGLSYLWVMRICKNYTKHHEHKPKGA
jgi:ribosomal silencing factor RsfS